MEVVAPAADATANIDATASARTPASRILSLVTTLHPSFVRPAGGAADAGNLNSRKLVVKLLVIARVAVAFGGVARPGAAPEAKRTETGTDLSPVAVGEAGSAPLTRSRVAYLVYRVERRLRARIDEAVRAHGVTTTEYVTLSVLRRHEGMSSAELARWAFVTPQAMNLVVSALERRGLVRRRSDPLHRRVLRAMVTAKGFDVLERCDRSVDVIEADMLGDMPAASVEELREMLAACAHGLEATRPRLPAPRLGSSRLR